MRRRSQLISMPVLVLALAATGACSRQESPPPAQASTGPAPAAAAGERVVNVYNWADYIDPEVLAEFERTSGIQVNYDTYDSQEMLETKLLTGRSGYDVVVVASDKLARLAPIGTFRKLDYARLPESRNLDESLHAALATFDPGNAHAVGYLWGTTGIGYDAARLKALAPAAPLDSWQLVFDPAIMKAMAACGTSVVDAPGEVIASALIALGRDPNAVTADSVAAAEKLLAGIRPHVQKIDSDAQIEDLAGGSACHLITWGTNVGLALARATEAGREVDFRYVIPREGAVQYFDALAIPADALHPDEAHAFIDFLMRPEIAARNAGYVGQATVNAAAMPLIDEALRNDPGIYPPADVLARLVPLRPRTQEESRLENAAWTRFRGGE